MGYELMMDCLTANLRIPNFDILAIEFKKNKLTYHLIKICTLAEKMFSASNVLVLKPAPTGLYYKANKGLDTVIEINTPFIHKNLFF